MGELCEKYGLEMQPETVPDLCKRFDLMPELAQQS